MQTFKDDLARADIFIGRSVQLGPFSSHQISLAVAVCRISLVLRRSCPCSLIFIEELADKVKEAVEAERDRLDAVLVFPSMPEVGKLHFFRTFNLQVSP